MSKFKSVRRGATRPSSPVAYPSPEVRQRIIERRQELQHKLITIMVTGGSDQARQVQQLVQKYGVADVTLVLKALEDTAHARDMLTDETTLYRDYRLAFARFGGSRRFLTKQEREDLTFEHGKLFAKRKFMSFLPVKAGRRERELNDLLLVGSDLWQDITPPATPSRPADFNARAPGHYDGRVSLLLKWGWDLNERRIADNAKNVEWRRAIPDLARMVLDEGLLNGWPGEPSGWSPYHALHFLGRLRASECAGQLLSLLDQPNDWLSDKLPWVWAEMGLQAEPPLWGYLSDVSNTPMKRGVAVAGLEAIANAHSKQRQEIVNRLAHHLELASKDDAEVNAYIVLVLDRMEAVETEGIVAEAFEQDKVDTSIIGPEGVFAFDK